MSLCGWCVWRPICGCGKVGVGVDDVCVSFKEITYEKKRRVK